jgi:leucyl-tRNA synthetase
MGNYRFLKRAWAFVTSNKESGCRDLVTADVEPTEVKRALNKAIHKIGDDIEHLRLNTPISTMMELLNTIGDKAVSRDTVEKFALILAPFAPHLAEEIWERLGNKAPVSLAGWPEYDPALIQDDLVTVVIQVGGKKRATIEVPPAIGEEDLKAKVTEAMASTPYKLAGGERLITVFNTGTKVPRLVNVVPGA